MLGALLDLNLGDAFTYDTFHISDALKVTYGCAKRNISLTGILSSELELTVESIWETIMGGSGSPIPSSVINTVDTVDQALTGHTVRQPWFSRGVWRGNKPLQIPISVAFFATTDAKTEVWDKIWDSIKLVLPAKISKSVINQTVAGLGGNIDSALSNTEGGEKMATILNKIIAEYAIPGPSTFYPLELSDSHPMSFYLGSLIELSFDACYFTNMKAKVSSSIDSNGYPQAAVMSFVVNSMDTPYLYDDSVDSSNPHYVLSTSIANQKADSVESQVNARAASANKNALVTPQQASAPFASPYSSLGGKL